MAQRRAYSTEEKQQTISNGQTKNSKESQLNDHNHDHDHHHSHSLFGHSHANGEEHRHSHGTEQIIAVLEGQDLLGDFVTLFCWRLSRKPPSEKYPYGFAKIETVGTSIISILLVGGALGIGFHSYHLLIAAVGNSAATLPSGPLQEVVATIASAAPTAPILGHHDVHAVDPNAAWCAAISVVVKEWLYRVTKVVADEEKSPVLLANAVHHRSDAYSSVVAFFAILGTWIFPAIPLDPIGGLLVSFVILRQGLELLFGAWGDLTDAGVPPKTQRSIERKLNPLLNSTASSSSLLGIHDLRARRSGSLLFVDLTAMVSPTMSVCDTSALDEKITRTLKEARKEITEVRIKFKPVE
ncbi:hypothetical protein C0991_001682 [Blastosporella zonata]|nr:hypothetical protein C0991_001682 [Blastosporella zonata]